MFCTKADISWNTCSSFLLSCSGSDDHGVDHTLIKALQSSSLTFGFGNSKNVTTCTFVSVSLVWPTLAIPTMPFSWFLLCYVEHRQLTMYSVWHKSLPDHARPCQNMWAPHYATGCDWLKSKGVAALTDRSRVVCYALNSDMDSRIFNVSHAYAHAGPWFSLIQKTFIFCTCNLTVEKSQGGRKVVAHPCGDHAQSRSTFDSEVTCSHSVPPTLLLILTPVSLYRYFTVQMLHTAMCCEN